MGYSARSALVISAAALFVGCGGSQSLIGMPGAMPLSRVIARHPDRGGSWMLPEAKGEDLLYVADYGVGVIVYSYSPSRIKYVGLLSTPWGAEGECVDKAQNIFVTGSSEIFEYAHGGTSPIAILGDPDSTPVNCSVDPTTGNLAVVGYPLFKGTYGVAIYKKGRGRPTFYADAGFGDYECGYDNKGNLFIGGYVFSGKLNFAELPKGSSTFENITLDQSFRAAGGIQWDGTHLAVGDLYAAIIYQFDISGSTGTEVGSTPLNGAGTVWQFFIDGHRVIAPSTFEDYSGFFGVYDYPGGGPARKTRINVSSPNGVVVSLARTSSR